MKTRFPKFIPHLAPPDRNAGGQRIPDLITDILRSNTERPVGERSRRFFQRSWFSDRATDSFVDVGIERSRNISGNLSLLYNKYSIVKQAQLLNLFWRAVATMSAHEEIAGALELRDAVLKSLDGRPGVKTDIRGHASEIMRLGGMIEAGRSFDAVCRYVEYTIHYQRWNAEFGYGWIVQGEDHVNRVEVDAIAGDTLIELKDMQLRGGTGKHLARLLTARKQTIAFNRHYNSVEVMLATDIANQLARYRRLIDEGVCAKLEFHATARGGVPAAVTDAMYKFFPPRSFQLIWYADLLSEGVSLTGPTGVACR